MKVFRIVLFLCAIAEDGYALPIQQDSVPTLVSLSPASAVQGATIEVRLTGSNFAAGSTAVTPSSGLVVNSVDVDTPVTLRALLQVMGPPGAVNLSVTTLAGTSSSMAFEIQPSLLDSAAPLEAIHFAGSIGGFGTSDGAGSQARFTDSCGCGSWTDGTRLFLTDSNAIRQITIATQVVTTIAGSAETVGFVDGVGTAARFSSPAGIWGNNNFLYVTDSGNSAIRKIDLASGQVTTAILLTGVPSHLYGDSNNLLYVSDVSNVFTGGLGGANAGFYRIRAVNLDTGVVTTVEQYSPQSNGGPQTFFPVDFWTDGLNLFVADGNISVVRRIYLPTGVSNVVASFNGADGLPEWIWSDGVHLYVVCDTGIIRVLDPNAANANSAASPQLIPQKEAGPLTGYGSFVYAYLTQIDVATGNTTVLAGSVNQSGTLDGIGSAALFTTPGAMWGDGKALYVSDSDGLNNNTIRKVDLATAQVTTLPVVPTQQPFAQALWGDEEYLYSCGSYRVNRTSRATGEFSIFAGSGVSGEVDGVGIQAEFLASSNLWGNDTSLFVGDGTAVRRIDKATGTVTTLAGGTAFGDKDGIRSAASFSGIRGIWGDGISLYVKDAIDVRKIVIATGEVSTVAGGIGPYQGGIWGDADYLYISNTYAGIQRITLATGQVTPLAGNSTVNFESFGAQDGIGTVAEFNRPSGIWGDGINLYVADSGNNAIRKLGVPGAVSPPASFTVASGGGAALVTGEGAGDLTVGFASIQPTVGSGAPDGFAVIQLRQNNILISEVAIPASPAIQSGRIYGEVNGPVNTGIAIANPNSQAVTISFYFTDASGNDFGSSSFTIPAGGQIAKFVTEAPFNSGSTFAGTVTFNASLPVAAVALRGFTNERSEFLMTSLPVAALPSASTASSMLPHFADGGGWTTDVLLVNPSDQPITGTVTFVPALTPPVAYFIPAHSSYALKTADTAVTIQTGFVLVAPAAGNPAPVAQGIFSFVDNGVTVTAAGVPSVDPGNAFRIYAEAEGSVQTGIAVANSSQAAATIALNLTNPDGTQAGAATLILPAGSHTAMFLNQIPGLLSSSSPFQGVLSLSTSNTGGISVLGLRGRYNERGDFLISEMPSFNDSTQVQGALYVPHFADGAGYSTQFILLGPPGQNATGVLQFFSQSGQSLAMPLNAAYVGP